MASVTSLGLHQPSGLHHAIEEQILPENPSPSLYRWSIHPDDQSSNGVEDELLVTETAVIWSRGRILCKTFKFDLEKERIIQALLAYFPVSDDQGSKSNTVEKDSTKKAPSSQKPALQRALVVFLKTQAHVYFLSGTNHVVHMPFEVELACAGPVGVLIQRKQKPDNSAPVNLKFPRVPTTSFISSQLTEFDDFQRSFSLEGGHEKPKPFTLGLNSTLEELFDSPASQPTWPRIVSLTDPLQELGLVVTDAEQQQPKPKLRGPGRNSNLLDPAEELLHIENIRLPGTNFQGEDLIIAVTVNREANLYSIWRIKYLQHDDPFVKRRKTFKDSAARRRSSIAPQFLGTPTTPAKLPSFRESVGAVLPGKRQRNSERIEKPVDLVSSLEKHDKEGSGIGRRSSRRLSSMLARADLSASQERAAFIEQPNVSGNASSRRHDSYSHIHGRSSSSYSHQIRPSLSSLLEAPLDMTLHEGFHNMGLEDPDFDGLQKDVLFSRIYQIPLDQSNMHVTNSDSPAQTKLKVFTLCSPSFAVDEHSRNQLLIGIQDSEEKRLNIIILNIVLRQIADQERRAEPEVNKTNIAVTSAEFRKAKNVVDACKLVEGEYSAILVLSESMDGRHELSTQAPWSERSTIWPELVFVDDTRSLQFRGRKIDRDIKHRKSEVIDLLNGSIVGLRYPRNRGIVDALDADGRLHQLKVQLGPACPQVGKILAMSRNILDDSLGERIHGAWLHIMQWLRTQSEFIADPEWSAVTILLFTLVLNLGRGGGAKSIPQPRAPLRKRRHASGSFGSVKETDDWKLMEASESTNALGYPSWMANRGWQWALNENVEASSSPSLDDGYVPKFISRHIGLTRDYMVSERGIAAIGPTGYLPTSLAKDDESRRKVVADIFLALHLLLEEQKLDIMTPDYTASGRTDLRVILFQVSRWLRWYNFMAVYEMGIQEDIEPKFDSGKLWSATMYIKKMKLMQL